MAEVVALVHIFVARLPKCYESLTKNLKEHIASERAEASPQSCLSCQVSLQPSLQTVKLIPQKESKIALKLIKADFYDISMSFTIKQRPPPRGLTDDRPTSSS